MRITKIVVVAFAAMLALSAPSALAQTTATSATPKPVVRKPAATAPVVKPIEVPKTFGKVDVLKLRDAGFTDGDIVAAINTAQNKYFDTDDLIALKAVVSKQVMAAVLGIPYAPEPTPAPVVAAVAAPAPTIPATPTLVVQEQKSGRFGFLRKIPGIGKNDDESATTATTNVFPTSRPASDACNRIKAYLAGRIVKDKPTIISNTTNCDAGQVVTEWGHRERRKVTREYETSAMVLVTTELSATKVRVTVTERARSNAGKTEDWSGGEVKADLSANLAAELEAALNGTPNASK